MKVWFACLVLLMCVGVNWRLFNQETSSAPPPPQPLGLIIPHHLLAESLIVKGLSAIPESAQYEQMVFIIPNHHESGDEWVVRDPVLLQQDHAYTDVLPYITKRFPQTPIDAVMISNRMPFKDIDPSASTVFTQYKNKKVLYIGSFDFSHYLSSDKANEKDKHTYTLIESGNYQEIKSLNNDYTDAPAALALFLSLMKLHNHASPTLLAHANSGLETNNPTSATTSYFVILF